jgi:glycosyltransferase involved in cell wall biosynthesis/GT2 family glycosyltransferase
MSTRAVSIIIPSRNRADLLERCLEAIRRSLNFADVEAEIIVVDDASEPPVAITDPSVLVVRGKGEGPSRARNRGIAAATGEIVAFTDDDALVSESWIESILDSFAGDPAAVGVRGPVVSPDYDPLFEHSVEDADGGRFLTCNIAYRRHALIEVGGFDPAFRYAHEDVDAGLRISRLGRVLFAPAMVVTHPGRAFRPSEWDRRGRFMLDDWLAFRRHPDLLKDRGGVTTAPLRIVMRRWVAMLRPRSEARVRSPRRLLRWARLSAAQSAIMAWLTLTKSRGHLRRPIEGRSGLRLDGLRIAYVGPVPSRLAGGAPGVEAAILGHLASRGCSIDCYVPTSKHFVSPDDIAEIDGIRVIEGRSSFEFGRWYSSNPLSKMVSFQAFQAMSRSRLASVLAAEHAMDPYDVIYQCSSIESFGVPGHRTDRPPLVIHPSVHAAGELRWLKEERGLAVRCQGRARALVVRLWMAARSVRQRRDIAHVDEVLAISKSFGELISSDYGVPADRVTVIPNAIDIDFFSPGPPVAEDVATILVLGRVVVRKGVDQIVGLSHRLHDLAGSVRILVVGDGSLWSDYRPLLDELDPEIAQVISHLGRDEVLEQLRGARLLIQASTYEPFGLTVAEALSCGVPVVVTDAVGAGEGVSSEVCTCVPVGDLDALETAVRLELARGPVDVGRQQACRSEALRLYAPAVVGEQALRALRGAVEAGRRSG